MTKTLTLIVLFSLSTALSFSAEPREFSSEEAKMLTPAKSAFTTVYEDESSRTISTENGMTYRVAKDRPIEKVAGLEEPMPLDAYLYGKFHEVTRRLEALEERLKVIEEGIGRLERILSRPPEAVQNS